MLKIISSQLKVVPGQEVCFEDYSLSSAMILKNEPFSFQLVYSSMETCQPISLDIDSSVPVESWRIDCLPIVYAANDYDESGYAISAPGLAPDLLEPRPTRPEIEKFDSAWSVPLYFEKNTTYTLNATKQHQSVLVTINPNGVNLKAGKYCIRIDMYELKNYTRIDFAEIEIEVIDAALPEQDFCVTNWFHVDCLCDLYGCEPYSEEFYTLFRTFICNMTKHRQNTLLLPAFTPALDIPVGSARRNVQLVDINKTNGEWIFDFSRLSRFMKTASECGIQYFEHCHLFSQWGAKKTPSIYDRFGKQLFGWNTNATSDEYKTFIRSYLKAYIEFAHMEGYADDQLIFHISDEPSIEMLESYKEAYYSVADLLAPFKCIDALSELEFYRQGLVKIPVANMMHAELFPAECESFWLYYTCGTYEKACSRRLVTNTAARTRVLGLQMYKYGAKGFLHWGYNYYYDRMSAGYFDPKVNPCGYKMLPGSSYLAYPERNGAVPSLREIHMREAFDDVRTLKLYEVLAGKEAVNELMDSAFENLDVYYIPEGNALYIFNQTVKQAIKANI